MSVAVVAHIGFLGTFGGTGSTTSSAIDTTGATFLIAAHAHYGGSSFSDNKGNTWTLLRTGNNGSHTLDFYVAKNPNVGSGHTFTVTNGYASACVAAMSGMNTVQDLGTGAPANTVSSGTSVSTSPFTPKYDNSAIFTALLNGSSTGTSVNGSFAIIDTLDGTADAEGGGLAWQQQGTAASITPTWSWTGSATAIIECLIFATAPSGSGGGGGGVSRSRVVNP